MVTDKQDSETEIWGFFVVVVCKNPAVFFKDKGLPAMVALCVCRSIASFLSAVQGWWQPQPGSQVTMLELARLVCFLIFFFK